MLCIVVCRFGIGFPGKFGEASCEICALLVFSFQKWIVVGQGKEATIGLFNKCANNSTHINFRADWTTSYAGSSIFHPYVYMYGITVTLIISGTKRRNSCYLVHSLNHISLMTKMHSKHISQLSCCVCITFVGLGLSRSLPQPGCFRQPSAFHHACDISYRQLCKFS